MSYQVLARKWRPQNFVELAGQDHVLQALVNALKQQRLHHAYLFTGTRGVGKTTIARIFAKCLNCETNGISPEPCGTCGSCVEIAEGRFVDLIEVDAASRTKVEDTRELLENVQYAPTRGRFKVYLIDEVHMLSTHSFNALLKTLEEPPAHVKFLLATTDPQKLPVTILSRCLQFNLKNMSPGRVVSYLEKVLTTEQLSYDEAGLWQIGQAANGSMRDALSLTDQAIAFGNGHISESDVTAMLGLVNQAQVVALLETLVKNDAANLLKLINELAEYQPDFVAICASLLDLLHRIAIEQQVPDALEDQLGDLANVKAIAQQVSSETIQLFYQTLLIGKRDLPLAHSPKAGFEMLLLRLIAFRPAQSVALSSTPIAAVNDYTTPRIEDTTPVIEKVTVDNLDITELKPELNTQKSKPQVKESDVDVSSPDAVNDLGVALQNEINDAVHLATSMGETKNTVADDSVLEDDNAITEKSSLSPTEKRISTRDQKDGDEGASANPLDPLDINVMNASAHGSKLDTQSLEGSPPFVPDEKPKTLDKVASSEKMAGISRLIHGDDDANETVHPADQDKSANIESKEQGKTESTVTITVSNEIPEDDKDEDEEDEIELIDDANFDRSAELVAVMQSETLVLAKVDDDEVVVAEERPIATNKESVVFNKAEIIVQPALGLEVESIAHFSNVTMQLWWLIAPRLPLTGLVQNILMNSCMLEAGDQGIKLEVPLEYGHMLNQVRYEQIQGAIEHYFDENVPLIIDTVADVSGVTAEEFAASKRAQAMQEAIDHLNAHPIIMALSSTMGGQLIYDSVKIKA